MYYLLFAFVGILEVTAAIAQSSNEWSVEFLNIGTHSSPRAADLNNDGVKDLIIGCGKKEFQALGNL
jgi:hypothetical protein